MIQGDIVNRVPRVRTTLALVLILVSGVFTGMAAAQVGGTASLSGAVTDASGGVLPGASVTLKNTETGVVYSTVTNSEGRYALPSIPVGTYDVDTELQGFNKSTRTGLRLGVGQSAELNAQLTVGAVSETLTVTATAIVVDTTSASLGARVTNEQIQGLPLNGRNFDQLSWLAPGVNQVGQSTTPGAQGAAGGIGGTFGRNASYSFAGLRPEGQSIMLDGADLQGFWGRGSGSTLAGVSLGIEAVGEYQVLTNTYGAQFGGFGAVVNSVTKSGTNKFHGSGYEFYRNSKFDSPNYFDVGGTPPPFHRNQFGLSLGGPIKQSKAFFFVNYEGFRQELASTQIGFVPDANTRAGLLPCSALDVVPAGCDRANPTLVNVGVNPAVVPYLALYPLPNGASTGDGRGRLTTVKTSPTNDDYLNVRLDTTLSNADNLMGRYIHDRSTFYAPKVSPLSGYGSIGDGRNQYLTIQERRVFNSTLVNTANLHLTQTDQNVAPEDTGATVPLLNFLGVPSLPAGILGGSMGLAPIGSDTLMPINNKVTMIEVADSMSWVKGAHALSFGGNLNHVVTLYNLPSSIGGNFSFNSLNQFLTARPVTFTGTFPTQNNAQREYTEIRVEPYIQDDWRVAKPLTLNLGLRWDFITNPTEKDGFLYTILTPLSPLPYTQVPNVYKKNPTLTNFNPRLGFAWTPFDDQKTAIRGGVGRYSFLLTARNYGLGYARTGTWKAATANFPPFPNAYQLGALAAAREFGNQILDYSDDFNQGYAWTYNVNVQHEFYSGGIVTVGYLGSRGERLPGAGNINLPTPASFTADGRPIRLAGAPNPNPSFGVNNEMLSVGISRFNSMQLSLTGRSRQIQYLVAYDLSSCMDNLSASYQAQLAGTGGTSAYSDGSFPNSDYGRCDFQARHNGKGSFVYLFPWTSNRLVSGWQTSLIAQLRSGLPFSPWVGFDIANYGTGSCPGCRPDLVAGANPNPVLGDPNKWFDPAAFTLTTIPRGTYGSLPRNTIDGPGLLNFDLSIQKETTISGDVKVQLRADVFNLFNRANFGIPNNTVFPTPNGVPSPTAGLITTTSTTPRQMQLSVRFVF